MSDVANSQARRPRRLSAAWWIVTLLLALALLAALVALQLREPDTIVRQIPSTKVPEPTPEMLAIVEQLNAETEDLDAEITALLGFVAAYDCPPGTAPTDARRLEELKRKAQAMLARAPAAGTTRIQPPIATNPTPTPPPAPALSGEIAQQPTAALSQLLETAVVFVLPLDRKGVVGSGTGFFIGPDLIVTNQHVIANGNPKTVLVTSAVLGDVVRAQVIASSPPGKAGRPDFALLRTERKVAPGTLPLSSRHGKLMEILAAGYPGMALLGDAGFLALAKGDRTAAPDMHQNRGEIRSTQEIGATTSILHTADVQSGYSGGPLLDLCGRVVGINTFIQVDASQSAKFNSALAAKGIHEFLKRNGTPHIYDGRACEIE